MRQFKMMVFCGITATLATACAGERNQNPPPSYQELKQDELASEREQHINDTRQHLTEVDQEISHLEAKLEHEKQFVDEQQQASWSQNLFELKQERSRLEADLERAKTASMPEWQEMRGPIGNATDSLQAGVRKLALEVTARVGASSASANQSAEPPKDEPNSGLCAVRVTGARAQVTQQNDRLTVTITTDDDAHVAELRQRANTLAKTDSYPGTVMSQNGDAATQKPASDSDSGANTSNPQTSETPSAKGIDVEVRSEDVDHGVKLTFTPKREELKVLKKRLESDAGQLAEGQCHKPTKLSVND